MCEHKSCGIAEKIWQPYEIAGVKNGVKPHSYCICCGTIKRVSSSSDRPKNIAYYIKVLTDISKTQDEKKRITKVQIRLIVKELEGMADFCDTYWVTESAQEGMFISVVQKYSKITEGVVKSFL
jgi:hypothetical protein